MSASSEQICCPACRTPFTDTLHCIGCGRTYQTVDGMPILLTAPLSKELEEEAKWYDAAPRQFSRGHHLAHAKARADITPGLRRMGITDVHLVLTVGCGTGNDLETILPVTKHIVGIDIAASAVRQFRVSSGLAGYVADCGQMPFLDGSIDAVVVSGLLHHLAGHDGLQPYLREFRRVLRPGGALLVVEPNLLYPVQWILFPVNRVMQKLKPGWRGLVPHERPLGPRFMLREVRRAGFTVTRYTSSTFLHNRLPFALAKLISRIEGPFCRIMPFKLFGWWLTLEAASPACA